MTLIDIIDLVGTAIEGAGVAAIVIGAIIASIVALRRLAAKVEGTYHAYRRDLGRSILLGLELLVAGDIVRTVAVTPTFASVGVLAVIVLIRTFLSFSLEVEITGKWPWQKSGPRAPEEV